MTPEERKDYFIELFDGNVSHAVKATGEIMKHARDISMVYDLTFDESSSYYNKVLTLLKKEKAQ